MIVKKAIEDAWCWREANTGMEEVPTKEAIGEKKWEPPRVGVVKYNVRFSWSRKYKTAEAAWVTRDHSGTVLMHSRRSFSEVSSKCEAEIQS